MDGEAVIINLANGMYYSMDQAGGVIWEMIEAGCRLDQVAAAVAARYEVSLVQAQGDVLRLAGDLLEQELVAITAAAPNSDRPSAPPVASRIPYEPPTLHVYSDMEELLALDPPTPSLTDLRWKG
jgi:hypothetical protein